MKLKFECDDLEVTIESFPAVIGRSETASLKVPFDPFVSRTHCEVDQTDSGFVIRDLQAKHGTYVNGRRVSEHRVDSGDRLGLGMTNIVVVDASEVGSR